MTESQNKVYEYLSKRILDLPSTSPLLVAISGKDASGKTVMADLLAKYIQEKTDRRIIRISLDDFMNERSVRRTPTTSEGESCYKYTFNFESFKRYVLEPLQPNGSYIYKKKIFDHSTEKSIFTEDQKADNDAIVIVDGVFLFRKDLVNYWNLKILLEVGDETAIERGARRDIDRFGNYGDAQKKYINRYIPSQTIYYREVSPDKLADIIINNDDYESPFIR